MFGEGRHNFATHRNSSAASRADRPRLELLTALASGVATSIESSKPLSVGTKHNARPEHIELVYDVIAAIDIKGFASDKLCRIVREEGGRDADVVDAHEAASRSF